MKVWTKNRDYKISKRWGDWWNVWFKDKCIGIAFKEEQARVCIYKHSGEKEYVKEEDFEEVK